MDRNGFTLIEVLIALLLAALGVAIAAAMFTSSTAALAASVREAERAEAEAGGLLWLEHALLSASVSPASGARFLGTPDSLSFLSVLPVPFGWGEPTRVVALLERGRVRVRADHVVLSLADSLATGAFDYLVELGSASPWLRRWESVTALPLAVRLRRTFAEGSADTVLFYVGRGS